MSPRLGLAVIPSMSNVEDAVKLAQEAEELGFDMLFFADQTFHRDPFTVLALCAQATERIRLGLGLTNPYTRHPVQVARAAGVIAELARGRFVLGFGAGNRPELLRGFGIEQSRIVPRLREAVTVTRQLLAGETVRHESPTLMVNGVALEFDPGYKVPIFLGTRGPRVLRLAGEIADGILIESLFTPGGRAWALDQIQAGMACGDSRSPEIMAWQIMSVDGPHEAPMPVLRRWASLLIKTSRSDMLREIGVSEGAIRAALADAGGMSDDSNGPAIDHADVGRVILTGSAEDIVAQAAELDSSGIGLTVGVILGNAAALRGSMRQLSEARSVLA